MPTHDLLYQTLLDITLSPSILICRRFASPKMNPDPARKAIYCALHGKWEEAASINLHILEKNPDDVDASMRLARACFELGRLKDAIDRAKKVLAVDPYHPIAQKCIDKWNLAASKNLHAEPESGGVVGHAFLEEPGKTRIVKLLHLGDNTLIGFLKPGQETILAPSKRRLAVTTKRGKYIGRLPDDVASRLIPLLEAGNSYEVYIKWAATDIVNVFIREIKRSTQTAHINSFPAGDALLSPIRLETV